MSKRRAGTQLTREDLDREEPSEIEEKKLPAIGIQLASQETLSQRKILKARRSQPLMVNGNEADQSSTSSPFAGLLTKPLTVPGMSSSGFKFSLNAESTTSPTRVESSVDPLPFKFFLNHSREPRMSPSRVESSSDPAQPFAALTDKKKTRAIAINMSFYEHISRVFKKDSSVDLVQNCHEYIKLFSNVNATEYPPIVWTNGLDGSSAPTPVVTVSEATASPSLVSGSESASLVTNCTSAASTDASVRTEAVSTPQGKPETAGESSAGEERNGDQRTEMTDAQVQEEDHLYSKV